MGSLGFRAKRRRIAAETRREAVIRLQEWIEEKKTECAAVRAVHCGNYDNKFDAAVTVETPPRN